VKVKRFGILSSLVLTAFPACAELVALTNGTARCAVETEGGRIASYCADGVERLWMPKALDNSEAVWVHGGIPLAWPWFGRIGTGDENVHGYAWKSKFDVKERTASSIVLALRTETALLEYSVALGDGLTLRMKTVNTSGHDLPLGQAFHPYFRVGERDAATVEGVDAAPISVTNAIDRSVRFGRVVDRRTYRLRDHARNRVLRIEALGSTGVNVWNPGFEKQCPGTIPGDEWRRFVAVEPFAMGVNRFLVLKPGEAHVLQMTVFGER